MKESTQYVENIAWMKESTHYVENIAWMKQSTQYVENIAWMRESTQYVENIAWMKESTQYVMLLISIFSKHISLIFWARMLSMVIYKSILMTSFRKRGKLTALLLQ